MSESNLRIVTRGELVPGFDRVQVEANLVQLCQFSPEKVTQVLSGGQIVLKSGLDQGAAQRYLRALTHAGIVCRIEHPGGVQPAAPPVVTVSATPSRPVLPSNPVQIPMPAARSGFPLRNLLLILLLFVVFSAVGALGITVLWRYGSGQIEQVLAQVRSASTEVTLIPPPAQPPVVSPKPSLSGVQRRHLYALLTQRQFATLTTELESIQQEFEADPRCELKITQAFEVFADPYIGNGPLYNNWVAQFPQHFAPYLARGKFMTGMGWEARGSQWASETSGQNFDTMDAYFAGALTDFNTALQLNPQLLPAYISMVNIGKAKGSDREQAQLIRQAQQTFPSSYQLYKKILDSNLPRWGGGYGEMNRLALQANEHAAQNSDLSFLYGKPYIDQAWYANRDKKYQEAIALYTRALLYGEYASLLEERGQVYEKLEDFDSALGDYLRAVEIEPDYGDAHRRIAAIRFHRGEFDAALVALQAAQEASTFRNKDILAWYSWAIKNLMRNSHPHLGAYVVAANQYEAAQKPTRSLAGKPLKSIVVQNRFPAPAGTNPYGLAWYQDWLYLTSYRENPGIYRINPEDGMVELNGAPPIVYKDQFGGLAADSQSLYHIQGHYDNDCTVLDPKTLETTREIYFYASQFQFSDLALHAGHLYAIGYHLDSDAADYRLLKFSQNGILRASYELPPEMKKSVHPGLTSDGTWLWVAMGDALYKMDPTTGDVVDGFSLPGVVQGLAWDGVQLWGATSSGAILTIPVQPEQVY